MSAWVELQKIIDTLPLGVHVIDARGRIVEANRAWLIHFGITMDHVRGRLLSDVMRDMIFFDGGGQRKDSPWEFERPAALETLKTKLPHTATFQWSGSGRMRWSRCRIRNKRRWKTASCWENQNQFNFCAG